MSRLLRTLSSLASTAFLVFLILGLLTSARTAMANPPVDDSDPCTTTCGGHCPNRDPDSLGDCNFSCTGDVNDPYACTYFGIDSCGCAKFYDVQETPRCHCKSS